MWIVLMEIILQQCLPLSEAEIQGLLQLKPSLDIVFCCFTLSSCPQYSLKALLPINPMCLLKYILNCEQNFPWRMPSSAMWCHVGLVRNVLASRLLTLFLAHGFFYPEDGGDMFLRNVGYQNTHMAAHPRRRRSP
jgi:hypothetical protein